VQRCVSTAGVAVGQGALFWNTTGAYNTAISQGALFFPNGSRKTAIGFQAMVADVDER
jgi:hypothetical protein